MTHRIRLLVLALATLSMGVAIVATLEDGRWFEMRHFAPELVEAALPLRAAAVVSWYVTKGLPTT